MSSKDLSFIEERDALLERWVRKGSLLQTVFIGANVGLTFTGRVAKNGGSELRLVRGEDELSVNLLGA
ncbi:MAG TPA: hypothetical protein VEF04_06250, partial [Blastocatellia bacterium]|nr:hypothetical protein [Blastocatellia bacterium]